MDAKLKFFHGNYLTLSPKKTPSHRNLAKNDTMNSFMRERVSLPFLILASLFCVCLIVANLVEIKTVDIRVATVTAGMAVFPLSYIINDCIVEVYGFRAARFVIWLGFAMNLLVTLILQLAIVLPGAESWQAQEAMERVYGAAPRILAASFMAFVAGSLVNAYVMNRMKARDGSRRFSLRAVVSTLWGEGVDSLIFFPLAFGGVLSGREIIGLIVAQTFLKTAYEIIILPVTIFAVRRLRRLEGRL